MSETINIGGFGPQPQRVMTRQQVSTEYRIRIAREITEPDDFDEEFLALASAMPDDTVVLQLVTPGGDLTTCDMICDAIRECQALTIGHIGIECASAGSAIALACDQWSITPSSTMMIHELQYRPCGGAVSSVRNNHEHIARINEEFVRRTYTGFLTEQEIEQVLDNKELYFYADDLQERLPKYAEYRQQEMEKRIEEQKRVDASEWQE